MPFASAADLVVRVDWRWIAGLVNDDGTRATLEEVLASTRVAAALLDAEGIVLAHVFQGGRYTSADLSALTSASLGLLKRLICDLAAGLLAEARQVPLAEVEKTIPGYGRAMSMLQQLALGNVVFDVEAAKEAGTPKLAYNRPGYLIFEMRRYFGDVWFTERQANRQEPPPVE